MKFIAVQTIETGADGMPPADGKSCRLLGAASSAQGVDHQSALARHDQGNEGIQHGVEKQ
ncbi:MAG: hypothetical protein ACEQSK_02765 [Sphingomonadaceae bacterium]